MLWVLLPLESETNGGYGGQVVPVMSHLGRHIHHSLWTLKVTIPHVAVDSRIYFEMAFPGIK